HPVLHHTRVRRGRRPRAGAEDRRGPRRRDRARRPAGRLHVPAAAPARPGGRRSEAAGPPVLVVQDNGMLTPRNDRAPRDARRDVREAASGEAALALLRDPEALPFDVVLSDLRLPGADGLEVLRAARERDPHTSVVLLTAYGSIETAVEAMRE